MHVTRSRQSGPWQRASETATRGWSLLLFSEAWCRQPPIHCLPFPSPPTFRNIASAKDFMGKKKITLRYRCFSHFNKANCWLPLVNIKILPRLFSLPQPTVAHIGYQEFPEQNHIIFTEYIQINDFSFELSPIRWIPQESQSLLCFYSKFCQS